MACCTNKMPSLPRQLVEVTKSMAASLTHLARTGHLAAAPEVIERRIKTCEGCNHFTGQRCRSCGCFVPAKAALAAESCPLGKW